MDQVKFGKYEQDRGVLYTYVCAMFCAGFHFSFNDLCIALDVCSLIQNGNNLAVYKRVFNSNNLLIIIP